MDGRILQRVPTNRFGVVSMSRAFRADRDRTLYMGEATHRKTTANKPKQGDTKMKIQELIETIDEKFDEVSHMLITDYPKGDYMDGYIAALGWILGLIE